MSIYDSADVGFTGTRERVALPPDKYGNSTTPELKVVHFIGTKPTKAEGLFQHSFLVASANGVEGTAFLSFNTREGWHTPEALSLAFNKGNPYPNTTQAAVDTFRELLIEQATEAVLKANTPEDQQDKAIDDEYENILTQIRINVGTIFRLQDWLGQERDPNVPLTTLVGAQFAGTVKKGNTPTTSNVKTVYAKSKKAETVNA